MAILAFPLVISFLKPHASHLSLLRLSRPKAFLLRSPPPLSRRYLTTASAVNTSSIQQHSSTNVVDEEPKKASVLTFQQAIQRLQEYWASVGCAVMQCSNTEVGHGAGTMNPLTYLRVLGSEPWNVAYVEPSIRPYDSRYGENPNRLQRHTQFQVILKPDPGNSQDLFIRSLSALGIDVSERNIRFVEDNWESPFEPSRTMMFSDHVAVVDLTDMVTGWKSSVVTYLVYGLERILMLLQGVDHFKKIQYADGITYGELFLENEKEMSAYYLEQASVNHIEKHFDFFGGRSPILTCFRTGNSCHARYDQLLRTSHAFNILDSRGFVGVTELARYFGRMRRALYEDAKFFYEMDTHKRFADFRQQLKGILFHEKLGTMLDKTMQLEIMAHKLSMDLRVSDDMLQVIKEAASLAMSDLATAVVTEFTSLSGIMARHYALRDGYSEQVV
ncbi:Glycine-tRNA ligase, alpha subunit [Corchorus olitorius]|uniref:glycine--tRNA ligase n=1 Tax=Corchorus olitorius TaxID=93759 RepID=A0A1R3HBN4_9ROSI|nr:Glycine-tRNA ligase, alpha subunit [Corchorus olitorius]